jgi:hypothetical protein
MSYTDGLHRISTHNGLEACDRAEFSACGHYRYTLDRIVEVGERRPERVTFVMLNPSTADATSNDATLRRCLAFAARWGMGALRVVNAYAWRSTDPIAMAAARTRGVDVIGPLNDERIAESVTPELAARVIVAWGAHCEPARAQAIYAAIKRTRGAEPLALIVTSAGAPGHPLRLAGDRVPQPWRPPGAQS